MEHILIIINKWWECEPFLYAILNHFVFEPAIPRIPSVINYPHFRPDLNNLPEEENDAKPRLAFTNKQKERKIEIFCISDLLEHLPDEAKFQSSSELKAKYLPKIFKDKNPSLVIAAGTAGFPSIWSENSSVVIGTKIFMHNFHPNGENQDSNWQNGPFDKILPSSIKKDFFDEIIEDLLGFTKKLSQRFFITPLNPSITPKIIANYEGVGLNSINVTDYKEYEKADNSTMESFIKNASSFTPLSLETTHGIIRSQSESPFIFISGITDRVGYFAEEVTPRKYSQNSIAAHNIGITVSRLIDFLSNR